MLGRRPPDLPLALADLVAVGLAVVAHDLLHKLADLLGRMVRIQGHDLAVVQPGLQRQAVLAAGDREEKEKRLAVGVGRRIVLPAMLRQHIGGDARLALLQGGVDHGAEELVGLGALVGLQQGIALGLVDQHAQAAVAGQSSQDADAAEQIGDLPGVVAHGVDAGELDPARHGLVHQLGPLAAHQPLAPGLALARRRGAFDRIQPNIQRIVGEGRGRPQLLAPPGRVDGLVDQVLQAALVAVRVAQAAQQAGVDGNGPVGRHLAQVQAGGGHDEVSLQRLLSRELHQVRLAVAILPNHCPHRAARLMGGHQPLGQAGPLALEPDGQLLDVLRRRDAHPQRLQQLASLILAGRHRLRVQNRQRRGRRQDKLLLAHKLAPRPAEAQPAVEAHEPLAAVAIDGRDLAPAILRMLYSLADHCILVFVRITRNNCEL